ncbi:amidohydrolase [Wuchereria bancrofti]|uniref:Amidohydrolase n=1 Tax=Wuchereria bancrofti TaxID=6293 RepID=J9ELQ2_WUCBA|nr:amidohydrolase [Wuchereria bancrofti]
MDSGSGGTFWSYTIKGAQIINDDSIYMADVLIQDGIIRELSSKIQEPQGAQIIDGTDKALMPAGIEIYTEFSPLDSADEFETGSKAALAGGTATIIDVIQPKPQETLLNAYDRLCKVAQSKSLCNVAFSVVISEWNDMIRKEMNALVHDKGINSFIINIQKDEQLFEILEYCRSLRVHARIIPENKDIIALLEKRVRASGISGTECFHLSRPEALEADMVNRISVLSKLTNCPVAVMSLSSPGAAEVLLRQRSNMLIPEIPVTALDDEKSNSALHTSWRYAKSPSAVISCFSSLPLCICTSGHCEMRKKDSTMENFTQNAISAVEERMSMLWVKGVLSGLIDPMRFVAITSSNAAKVFNLYPKKGRIAVGADADLVLWKLTMTHQTSTLNQHPSLFKMSTAHSRPVMTICGGRIAYSNGKFDLERGKLVGLGSHSPYLYCMLKQLEGVQLNGVMNDGISSYSNHSNLKENWSNSSRSFPVKSVQKQQFDSVYSAALEDTRGMRASTKVLNPPGGRSTGFW